MNGITVHFEGLKEVQQMLDQYSPSQLQNKMRRMVRAGARPFQGGLKSEAQSHHGGGENVPLSFQKVPAAKVTTRGGISGRDIEAYVRPKSPLFNIFQPGAGRHTIAPKHGVLKGPAGSGSWDRIGRKRKGAFFSLRPVSHPGMSDRDILGPAFDSKVEEAIDAIAGVLFDQTAFTSIADGNISVFFP